MSTPIRVPLWKTSASPESFSAAVRRIAHQSPQHVVRASATWEPLAIRLHSLGRVYAPETFSNREVLTRGDADWGWECHAMGSTVDDLRVGRCESTAHRTLVVALGQEHGFHSLLRAVIDELGYQCYAEHLQPATVQHVARLRPAAILVDVDFGHERQAWAVIQGTAGR